MESKESILARGVDHGWKRAFDDPILLPSGRKLITLLDAATYATKLPKKEADTAESELRGPTMFARIGVMRAPTP